MLRRPGILGQTWLVPMLGTPLGPLSLTFTRHGLAALSFPGDAVPRPDAATALTALPSSLTAAAQAALRELEAYFSGRGTAFASLTLDLHGTSFQLRVWQELRRIPWGGVISYGDLARRLGNPKAPRAVGQALAANPLPIIVPCHRVIAADGSLGGYSSGLDRKRWLLQHEGALR